MKYRIAAVLLSAMLASTATATPPDSTRAHHLRPLEVLGIKQMPDGGTSVEAVTDIGPAQIRRLGIESPKDIALIAPNFYMPAYGSRMTSSIYVRGLGARIDQPVVGLTVDNIPYLNKDNYDFDIADIESIEILRGAQTVLNGRNTMGGQINIRTLSPLRTEGIRLKVGYSSGNTTETSASVYHTIKPGLGMSLSTQCRWSDGFFRNTYDDSRVGKETSGSFRWKTAWRPTDALSVANTAVMTLNEQDGYPYQSLSSGQINYNDTCSYDRTAFADGITVAWAGKRVVVTSVTSVQYLDDDMHLDQDFLPLDYFTLRQKRREWAFTEDLFTRGSRGNYSWLGGIYAFYRTTDMQAPVTFRDVGIAKLIEDKRNQINPEYPIRWDSRSFVLDSDFDLRARGFALYHESTYNLGKLRLEAGLRLDIERTSLTYHSNTNTGYTTMHILPNGSEETFSHTPVDIDDHGDISRTYTELLPKLTVSYNAPGIEPYISFSKGYKAGGYNTQMFSDVLQQRIMSIMGLSENYSFDQIVAYKPESSYNYEAGVHWKHPKGWLSIDAALFFIDCRNQQLTVFPPGTVTGRMMTNAGRTRSYGAELTAKWQPCDNLDAMLSYGYTNATFRHYNDGRKNYRGKRVPYSPEHTVFAEVHWRIPALSFCGITPSLTATARALGDIFWDEANTARQPFYILPGVSLTLSAEHWSARLWAENITATRYNTFYFVSMGNAFVQRGNPRQLGVSVRLTI